MYFLTSIETEIFLMPMKNIDYLVFPEKQKVALFRKSANFSCIFFNVFCFFVFLAIFPAVC